MEFKIDRDVFLKSLAHVQGVVERKNTLPILGNVMLEANENYLKIITMDETFQPSEKEHREYQERMIQIIREKKE